MKGVIITELNLTTPALLFPAISLLLLAYTNRFVVLAKLARELVQISVNALRLQLDQLPDATHRSGDQS